jgi:SWI/SNF-related matrix-associated actin-dependent regulator of chromatin subfamily A3
MVFNTNEELNNIERKNRIDRLENKKKDLNTKINDIKDRINKNNICSICYETIDNKTLVKCCSNTFCFKCINLWLCQNASCPLCKNNLKEDQLYLIQDKEESIKNEIIDSNEMNKEFDKLQNLEILLRNKKKGSKYLIFSEYDISFERIISIINNDYKYSYLKGNKYIIQKILKEYKEGDLDILLVNIHNYGSGLNLENTTDIIMFHKFDANIEEQVIGRAQRFGREDSLNIYYLLNQNEISNI